MKKQIRYIWILFFMLIDGIIYTSFQGELRIVLNFLNFGVFYYIYNRKYKSEIKYWDMVCVLLPVVGYGLFYLEQVFYKRDNYRGSERRSFETKVIFDNEKSFEEINVENEINIEATEEVLNIGTVLRKKAYIATLSIDSAERKVSILDQSLQDDDLEVVHYSAVQINGIDRMFQQNIKDAKQKGEDKMAIAYMDYCNSGLLDISIKNFYVKKVLQFLEKEEVFNVIPTIEILMFYKKNGLKSEIYEFFNNALKEKELSKEILDFGKKFFYGEEDFEIKRKIENYSEEV